MSLPPIPSGQWFWAKGTPAGGLKAWLESLRTTVDELESRSGTSVTSIAGSVDTAANLPASAPEDVAYVTQDTRHLWAWNGTEWIDLGTVQGPAGSDANVTDVNVAAAIGDNTTDALAPVIDARAVQVREAPVTPYRFGATATGMAVDNTAALAALWQAVAAVGGAEVYLPPGVWRTSTGNLPLATDVTVKGAGRTNSQLRNTSPNPLFTWDADISGVRFDDLYLNSTNGTLFKVGPNGGIHASTFKHIFINQQNPLARIWEQEGPGAFIQMVFEEVEMQRAPASANAVTPFHIVATGGAANCNLFKQVRINGLDNYATPFFYVESTLPQTYLTDWTFLNIVGEQNPGGLIHTKSAFNWNLINTTDEDVYHPGGYVADLFRFDANAHGLAPRSLTFIGSNRRGATVAEGAHEIWVHPDARSVSVINCDPTPVSAYPKLSLPVQASISGRSAWRTYTPTLGGTGTSLGDGVATGAFAMTGQVVHFRAFLTLGSTTTFGSSVTLTLPVPPAAGAAMSSLEAIATDTGNAIYQVTADKFGAAIRLRIVVAGGAIGPLTGAAPFTWAAGDTVEVRGVYEPAA